METVAIILLAAGGSTRLGSAKQLIDVDGEPLVRRVARRLIDLDAGPVGVVIGGRGADVRAALAGVDVTIVENERWEAGIGTSIGVGVAWAESIGAGHALVALCDQPDVDAGHLRALIAARAVAAAVATRYAGQLGVPAVFGRSLFGRLRSLTGDRGAKSILSDPTVGVRAIDCELANVDLDTPDDVRRWHAKAL